MFLNAADILLLASPRKKLDAACFNTSPKSSPLAIASTKPSLIVSTNVLAFCTKALSKPSCISSVVKLNSFSTLDVPIANLCFSNSTSFSLRATSSLVSSTPSFCFSATSVLIFNSLARISLFFIAARRSTLVLASVI